MALKIERKDLNLDYHLEAILEEMVKHKTAELSERRTYEVKPTSYPPATVIVEINVKLEGKGLDKLFEVV